MELDNLQNVQGSYNSAAKNQTVKTVSSYQEDGQPVVIDQPRTVPTKSAGYESYSDSNSVSSGNDDKKNIIDDRTRSTAKLMDDAVNEANKKLAENRMNQELQMSMHNVTKAIMVKVVDTSTKEVIREYPPQKLQDMIAKMWLQAGILVDEKR